MVGFILLVVAFLAMTLMLIGAARKPDADQSHAGRRPWTAW